MQNPINANLAKIEFLVPYEHPADAESNGTVAFCHEKYGFIAFCISALHVHFSVNHSRTCTCTSKYRTCTYSVCDMNI